MKKIFKTFLISIIALSIFQTLSCGVKDIYAGGGIVELKLPGKFNSSRETYDYSDLITKYVVELTRYEESIPGRYLHAGTITRNALPGTKVKIAVDKEGVYTLSISAYKEADRADLLVGITEGTPVSDDSIVPGSPSYFTVARGKKTVVSADFSEINFNPCHEITGSSFVGTKENPITNLVDLEQMIKFVKTKEAPTRLYIKGSIGSQGIFSATLNGKIYLDVPEDEEASLNNICFIIGENKGLTLNENINVSRNVDFPLFQVSENGELNLNSSVISEAASSPCQEPAIKVSVSTEKDNETLKAKVNINGTSFKNFKYNVIEIAQTKLSYLAKMSGKISLKNVSFENCSSEIDTYGKQMCNIKTGSDIHLSGEDNVIDSIYLNNAIPGTGTSNEGGDQVYAQIIVSRDFQSRHSSVDNAPTYLDFDSKKNIGTASYQYCKYISDSKISRNGKPVFTGQFIALEPSDTLTEDIKLNSCIDTAPNSTSVISSDGKLIAYIQSGDSGFGYSTSNYSTNLAILSNQSSITEGATLSLSPSTTRGPYIINNWSNGSDLPFHIYSTNRFTSKFTTTIAPAFNISKTVDPAISEYDVFFDGTELNSYVPNPAKFSISVKESTLTNTNNESEATLINIFQEEQSAPRVFFKNMEINHAATDTVGHLVSGITTSGKELMLEDVTFINTNGSDAIGGHSIVVDNTTNTYGKKLIRLKGNTKLDTIYIKPTTEQVIINIEQLTKPDATVGNIFKIELDSGYNYTQIFLEEDNGDETPLHERIEIPAGWHFEGSGTIQLKKN